MVETQIKARGVRDPRVLEAMRSVPRHLFIPPRYSGVAYADQSLPIGHGQTVSQPYIVAYMTEALQLRGVERVLEIGTGSGYQAAVLSLLVKEVYTVENIRDLVDQAMERLQRMGHTNVHVKWADGYSGWPEKGPFDAILGTAAPPDIPHGLLDQLRANGRMVLPVGEWIQEILRVTKVPEGIRTERLLPVRFVPMVHRVKHDTP
jgi:protein-L-isoaspartate(D-aspartate) O-methyltransferase